MTPDIRAGDVRAGRHRSSAPFVLTFFLAALAGCSTLGTDPGQPLVPDRVENRTGPFALYTNARIAPDSPAIRSLQSLETDLASHLGLRAPADAAPIEVYVLKDREAFGHFLRFYYPELPPRRAFFLAQGPKRMVYTFTNDRLDEDLRHEGTHALLHVSVGDLPLWLDEGLAEYFEGPDSRQGVNPEHIQRLPDDLKRGWTPDLARLESLTRVGEMSPRDYRESWAWVHYLLNGPPAGKAALLGFLADMRTDPQHAATLSARLQNSEHGGVRNLVAHIDRIRTRPVTPIAVATPTSDPAVHLQDSAIEPAAATRLSAPRRSLFSRMLSFFGGPTRHSADRE
jgi:hypothetical protein